MLQDSDYDNFTEICKLHICCSIIKKPVIWFVLCICTYYYQHPNIIILLNHCNRYQALSLIVTLQIQIAMSMHRNICSSYTCLLAVFQTAVILKCREEPSQNFTLTSPLFIIPTLCNHQQPFGLTISIKSCYLFAYK